MGDIPPIERDFSTDAAGLALRLADSVRQIQEGLAFNEDTPIAFPLSGVLVHIQQLYLRAAALSRTVQAEIEAQRREAGDYAASCHGPQYRHQREHQC